jgi:AcrR family transcriptional regulator
MSAAVKKAVKKKAREGARTRAPEPANADAEAAARILQVAERLFLDFGYVRFTMDQLALEMGMSKKTLYKHYVSKDDLLGQVLDARSARLEVEMSAYTARTGPDFERTLVEFVEYVVERFAEVSEPFLQDVRRSSPELFRKIEAFREQAIPRHVEAILVQGAAAGVIRSDLPFPVVAAMLLHAAQQMILPRPGRTRLMLPPGQLMDILVRVLCEGIIVRSDGSGAKRGLRPRRS